MAEGMIKKLAMPAHLSHKRGGGVQMNRYVSFTLKNLAKWLVVLFAFCATPFVAGNAEELLDPTRRPVSLDAGAAGKPSLGLQSIIISKNRRAAIIDGETVELRGKHGDATLIEVSENGVVLQGSQGRQVLTLFFDVKIMQKEMQIAPKVSVKEVGLQKIKPEARKERK